MAVPTIASGALKKLVSGASARGADAGAILRAAGVPPSALEEADSRVPIASLHAAWDRLLDALPRIDVETAAYAPGDYGIVGFVVMNSATLADALKHLVRYVGLWTDDPAFELDGATVRFTYRHAFRDSPGMRRATEAAPVEMVHGARLLTRSHVVPREVRFAHGPPDDVLAYTRFFGCPVRFDAEDHAIVFRSEDLDLPLAQADAQLGAFLRGHAESALAKRGTEDSPLDGVRRILAQELQRGVPSIDVVAARMAASERTLRRRLEASGTTFRALLDETRAELARSYVADARMPLAEVAFMLGFSEPSAFHRAFKRWTRTTPAAFRAKTRESHRGP